MTILPLLSPTLIRRSAGALRGRSRTVRRRHVVVPVIRPPEIRRRERLGILHKSDVAIKEQVVGPSIVSCDIQLSDITLRIRPIRPAGTASFAERLSDHHRLGRVVDCFASDGMT